MATKTYNLSWMRQFRASNNTYYGSGTPIRVGNSEGFHSYLGIPPQVRTDLKSSRSGTTMKLRLYVTNATPEWDIGRHKLAGSSEPSYTTMPWYNYLKPIQGFGTGWLEITLTNDFMSDYENGTYQGLVLYSGTGSNWFGSASNTGDTSAQIVITGDWNDPPNMPTITYPKGGEIVDKSLTVKWTKPTDPDGDALKYQVAFMDGDGSGWKYFETAYGATQLTVDTSNGVEGSRARIAVRAYDGQEWSGYRYSNYFTIDHNRKPSQPTQLSPANGSVADLTDVVRFSWKHNDDGAQAGYQLAWREVNSDGVVGSWTHIPSYTTFSNTTNQFYNMPANKLPAGTIEWTVRTKDQQGETSDYANYVRFKASEPTNAPVMLTPIDTELINTTRVTAQWSSLNQLEYEVILTDSTGAELFRELKASSVKLVQIPVDLKNNSQFTLKVRVKDSTSQLWSEYTTTNFGTSFTPPTVPVIKRTEDAGSGVINVFYASADSNIMPAFLVGNGEMNSKITPFSVDSNENLTITGEDSYSVTTQLGQIVGLEITIEGVDIPIIEGATYRISADSDVAGVRVFLRAFDASGVELGTSYNPPTSGSTGVTHATVGFTIPVGTSYLVARFYNTEDLDGTMNVSNCSIVIESATPTDYIDLYRREYTPTGLAPWIKIGERLSKFGAFLDYTPASGIVYEYKAQAHNVNNETSSESEYKQAQSNFIDTYLQEAHNLSSIVTLQYSTSKELDTTIESATHTFAGRRDPVREFGEHEETVIKVDWEVDSIQDVIAFQDMWRRRDILLFRDMNGRRHWVTTDKLNVKDKEIYGFELSAEFTVASYTEDLDKKQEELM
jgi:hypothetical protein